MPSDNITVNGLPLEEVIDAQQRAEIHEHRATEERVKLNRHRITKRPSAGGARTRPGRVVYVAGQRETHVIIAGLIFDWAAKAPYVNSGHSLLGALEYNQKEDLIKCHECGGWIRQLAYHVGSHGISVKEYRRDHGFRMATRLRSPTVPKAKISQAAALAAAAAVTATLDRAVSSNRIRTQSGVIWATGLSPELANLQAKCKAQLLHRLKTLRRDLGRTPTFAELNTNGLNPGVLRRRFGIKVRDLFVSLGFDPRPRGHSARVSQNIPMYVLNAKEKQCQENTMQMTR